MPTQRRRSSHRSATRFGWSRARSNCESPASVRSTTWSSRTGGCELLESGDVGRRLRRSARSSANDTSTPNTDASRWTTGVACTSVIDPVRAAPSSTRMPGGADVREIRAVERDRVIALDQLGDGAAHIVDVSFVDPTRQAMHDARHSDSLSLTEEASRPGAFRLTTARSARRFPRKGSRTGRLPEHSPDVQAGGSFGLEVHGRFGFGVVVDVADAMCERVAGRAASNQPCDSCAQSVSSLARWKSRRVDAYACTVLSSTRHR